MLMNLYNSILINHNPTNYNLKNLIFEYAKEFFYKFLKKKLNKFMFTWKRTIFQANNYFFYHTICINIFPPFFNYWIVINTFFFFCWKINKKIIKIPSFLIFPLPLPNQISMFLKCISVNRGYFFLLENISIELIIFLASKKLIKKKRFFINFLVNLN